MNETEEQTLAPLTRVWWLRHAETADPTVFHGAESDIGLSARGRRMAEVLAPAVAALRPDVLIASGMRRAQETVAPFAAACGLPVQTEPLLHERRVGALSGTRFQASEGLWSQTLGRWMAGDTAHAPPGAESYDAIRARILPVWQRVTTQHAGRTVVIVAHGAITKVLLMSLGVGYAPADWHRMGAIHNLAWHELRSRGAGWELLRFNELDRSLHGL